MTVEGSQDDAILVFAKKPLPGQVKTRLAADIGADEACDVYRTLLDVTLMVVGATPSARYLFEANGARLANLGLPTAGFEERAQMGDDLGARMANAFAEVFAAGHRRAICIGSDCPDLTPSLLRQALTSLRSHDTVFGPALDGGYYLVGQRAPGFDLFSDIPWSTADVWPRTRARLEAKGWSHAELPTLEDVDDIASLARWRARLAEPSAP